jgi:hypothetical protein
MALTRADFIGPSPCSKSEYAETPAQIDSFLTQRLGAPRDAEFAIGHDHDAVGSPEASQASGRALRPAIYPGGNRPRGGDAPRFNIQWFNTTAGSDRS